MNSYKLDYKKRPSTVIAFRLTGDDLQPNIITQALGVTPHRAWTKGDVRSITTTGKLLFTFGCWSIVPQADRHEGFEAQLRRLLDLLEALPPIIHTFTTQYRAELSVGYSSGERNFGFSIDQDSVARLCRLNVALDFDIYAVRGSSDDEDIVDNAN